MDENLWNGEPWIREQPHPRQQTFLALSDVREVFYGGAARGGKTKAALMAAAQYVNTPGYSALLLRETFPDLHQSDGFIPASKAWWLGSAAAWSEQHRRWTFPSGATISFGHLDRDDSVYQYQGSRHQFIDIDELTQHTEWRYRYLFSRLDRPADGPLSQVPLRMRAQSNPGGRGHEWVKKRFIDPQTRDPGAVFVPARVEDNPSVDRPAYVESLSYLDPITRAQLLVGDWDAYAGGRFRREWFKRWEKWGTGYRVRADNGEWRYVDHLRMIFQTCDPAASEKKTADWTVLSTWGVSDRWELFWLDCCRWQREIPDLPGLIEAEYKRWPRVAFVAIERVGANAGVYQLCLRRPMIVKPFDPLGLDKLVRATPAMNLAASGRLYLPHAAPWLEDAEGELLRFTGDSKKDAHDDIVDTVSMAAALFQEPDQNESTKPSVRSSW